MKLNGRTLFVLINILLASYYFDGWSNGNTTSRVLPAVSYIKKGTYHFEQINSNSHDKSIIDGKHYTDKAPLPTLLFIPVAVVLEKTGVINLSSEDYSGVHAWAGFLFGTIPFLLIILLTYQSARKQFGDKIDILYLILPWYGSFIFSYSASMYSHVFAGLLLILALLALKKEKFMLTGFIIGAIFVTEYPLAIVGIIWALQIWYKKGFKKVLLFGLGGVPFVFLIGFYNYALTGNPFTLLYKYVDPNYAFMHTAYGMKWPSLKISLQILFGQYKGILLYCPVFALVLFFGIRYWLKQKLKWSILLLDPILPPFIMSVLLISSYTMWWGGWAFGARHMIALTILLLFHYLPILANLKIPKTIGYSVLLIGLLIGLLAKITFIYSVPTEVEYPIWFMLNDFLTKPTSNPNNLLVRFMDVDSRTAAYIYLGLFFSGIFVLAMHQAKSKNGQNQ